jgi:hypothetical protein
MSNQECIENANACRHMAAFAKTDVEQKSWFTLAEAWFRLIRWKEHQELPVNAETDEHRD